MNLCVFTGRLTADPELVQTSSGKSVVKFSIAVNEGKDKVTFVNCQAWEKTAEFISQYFTKGKPISVQSKLRIENWDDKKTGETRRTESFVVERVDFVPGSPNDSDETDKPKTKTSKTTKKQPKVAPETTEFNSEGDDDEDVPF